MIIKVSKKGVHYLLFEEQLFRLEPEGSTPFQAESRLEGRQLGLAYHGSHGRLMQQFVQACDALNIPKYYSWHGIMNSFGDHADVSPPWQGKPENWLDATETIEL